MSSLGLQTKAQNTEEVPGPGQSPVIRVSIKSRSSEKYLGVRVKERAGGLNSQGGVRKEYKVNVRYFELVKNEPKGVKALSESKSVTARTKISQGLAPGGFVRDFGPSKSYRKMTRLYMRNFEVFNFLKRDLVKGG